jgi:hypothetical protein
MAEREGFEHFRRISGLQLVDSSLPALPLLLHFPERITQNCPNSTADQFLLEPRGPLFEPVFVVETVEHSSAPDYMAIW